MCKNQLVFQVRFWLCKATINAPEGKFDRPVRAVAVDDFAPLLAVAVAALAVWPRVRPASPEIVYTWLKTKEMRGYLLVSFDLQLLFAFVTLLCFYTRCCYLQPPQLSTIVQLVGIHVSNTFCAQVRIIFLFLYFAKITRTIQEENRNLSMGFFSIYLSSSCFLFSMCKLQIAGQKEENKGKVKLGNFLRSFARAERTPSISESKRHG